MARMISRSRFIAACEAAGISPEDACSHSRLRVLAYKRFQVMATLRDAKFSFPEIGRKMGGRDHSSIWHGVRRWQAMHPRAEAIAAQ